MVDRPTGAGEPYVRQPGLAAGARTGVDRGGRVQRERAPDGTVPVEAGASLTGRVPVLRPRPAREEERIRRVARLLAPRGAVGGIENHTARPDREDLRTVAAAPDPGNRKERSRHAAGLELPVHAAIAGVHDRPTVAHDVHDATTTAASIGIHPVEVDPGKREPRIHRSEEHTSELQSPYVISYAVFC